MLEANLLSAQVRQALALLETLLGEVFAFDDLILVIETLRAKPLRIETDTMPAGMSGYCIALSDVDLICTRRGADPLVTAMAQLHELAHLLLGHIPRVSNGTATPTYAEFVQHRAHADRRRHFALLHPLNVEEHDAETLATLLFEQLHSRTKRVPHLVVDLYGFAAHDDD